MEKFIEVCVSSLGGERTGIYLYVNPMHIVELHFNQTQYERNIEATLIDKTRVIILYQKDLVNLVGEEYALELKRKVKGEE